MPDYRQNLPWNASPLFLCHVGLETDLIFNKNIDLPGFAAFPLLETQSGRAVLEESYRALIEIARKAGVGLQLDSPTWMANKDRAAELGYSPSDVAECNKQAIDFLATLRKAAGYDLVVLSANVGPRSDAYQAQDRMTVDAAETYHAEQMHALPETETDVVTAMTLTYSEEAAGIIRAAKRYNLPVVASFTVETDGLLPTGQSLRDAIEQVDKDTGSYAEHFMINCAHPDHFDNILDDAMQTGRLKGLVANASRCSHEELDNAQELDDGDPAELAEQLISLKKTYPQIFMLGGCCGTDVRHITEIASQG